jgi:hypothetical protein
MMIHDHSSDEGDAEVPADDYSRLSPRLSGLTPAMLSTIETRYILGHKASHQPFCRQLRPQGQVRSLPASLLFLRGGHRHHRRGVLPRRGLWGRGEPALDPRPGFARTGPAPGGDRGGYCIGEARILMILTLAPLTLRVRACHRESWLAKLSALQRRDEGEQQNNWTPLLAQLRMCGW